MIHGIKEIEEFEKATHCHICEGGIKRPKIDHLGKIHQVLKDIGLPNRYPSEQDVIGKMHWPNMKISKEKFQQVKAKLEG